MTDNTLPLAHGDQYVVLYKGGPYDGQNDTRISTDGDYDKTLTVLAAVDGHETQQVYTAGDVHSVGDQLQISYNWDAPDSDSYKAPEERGEL